MTSLISICILISCFFQFNYGFDGFVREGDEIISNKSDFKFWNSNHNGWGQFEIAYLNNEASSDEEIVYMAGKIEGMTTQKEIYESWNNIWRSYCDDKLKACKKMRNFLAVNYRWMKEMIKKNSKTDKWWHQVNLFYYQIKGILDGYNKVAEEEKKLTWDDLYMMNIIWDIGTLVDVFATPEERANMIKYGSCSALIKITPGFEDVLVAHNTWTGYTNMVRVMKRYSFPVHLTSSSSEIIPGMNVTFSSYPGAITSGDDYYILSSGLVTMETTNEIYNSTLYKHIHPENQVLESIRVHVANKISRNGSEWANNFIRYNSGTYNNQWMILDYNKLIKRSKPKKDFLWVVEQIPGFARMKDVTEILIKQQYWASYNIPYFKDIYELTGYKEKEAALGDWYSHDNCPRAKIFRRNHTDVVSVDTMMDLMRYNDYKNDPLSICEQCTPKENACNAIASRCDLNPENGTYNIPQLGHRLHGAIDAKVTSSELAQLGTLKAVSGPTNYPNLPVFRWSGLTQKEQKENPHLGQTDSWNYKPVLFNWSY